MTFQKMLSIAVAVAAICGVTVPVNLAAATVPAATPNIVYTASGTFASPATSGADSLKLAGEPFSVTISVSPTTVPFKTGPGYAAYNKLTIKGQVHSGLVGSTPVPIASGEATIIQGITPNVSDTFIMEAPIKVVGMSLTIKATITMPLGTITKPLLHPFNSVTLTPTNAVVSYADTTNTTVLGIETGTLSAVLK